LGNIGPSLRVSSFAMMTNPGCDSRQSFIRCSVKPSRDQEMAVSVKIPLLAEAILSDQRRIPRAAAYSMLNCGA
jgi:hypothetical protein